jgi:hypothetical protein
MFRQAQAWEPIGIAEQVAALAVKEMMVMHVPRRRSGARRRCRIALVLESAAADRSRSRRIFHRELAFRHVPAPRHVWHGLAIVLPVPRQFRHGARLSESLLVAQRLARH